MLSRFSFDSGKRFHSGGRWLIIALAVAIAICLPFLADAKDRKQAINDKGPPAAADAKEKKTKQNALALDRKMEEVTIAATDADMTMVDVYVGDFTKPIVNPRCLDVSTLIAATPEAKEAAKAKMNGSIGKYWILLSKASDRVERWTKDFIEARKISFLCKREKLIPLLLKQEQYKGKSEEELIAGFDVTDQIIAFSSAKSANESKEDEGFP